MVGYVRKALETPCKVKKLLLIRQKLTFRQKKGHRRICLCQIYLLKGGQLVNYIIPHNCFMRVTAQLKCYYVSLRLVTGIFTIAAEPCMERLCFANFL